MSEKTEKLLSFVQDIPNIHTNPLVFTINKLKENDTNDTLWLEFGVYKGISINLIAENTNKTVYGFDSFEGLPEDWRPKYEKGFFSLEGNMPSVRSNVVLIKGLFQDTLKEFLLQQNKKISFIHIDSDLYSSAKYILDTCKPYFSERCYIVFDELVNFEYFESSQSELMALYDFLVETKIEYEWVGMNGELNLTLTKGMKGYYYTYNQNAAICLKSTLA
jgi:hypothetical protein